MLKILLLDCAASLHEKLLRDGFDVEAGTFGRCTPDTTWDLEIYDNNSIFTALLFINEPRFATDFSIRPRKLSWIRRQKSGGPESKSPTLDSSK